jgi:hypothetical protein
LTTIQEVINELESIIAKCIEQNSRAGYFAVLYHRVTCRIKEGIEKKEFEDNTRMELLDVLFAKRYIDAWHGWKNGQLITKSWQAAFDVIANNNTVIMQHLLAGINAHINLDLGIAAVETMKGYTMDGVQKDFNSINNILAALVDEVQDNIGKVSALMPWVDRFCRGYDEMLVCFSINTAREGAWMFANELSPKAGNEYTNCIRARDERIALLAIGITMPKGKLFAFIIRLISWFETGKPATAIGKLKYVVKEAAEKI